MRDIRHGAVAETATTATTATRKRDEEEVTEMYLRPVILLEC
jgi:hypothetical protein